MYKFFKIQYIIFLFFIFSACSTHNTEKNDSGNKFRAEILDRNGNILALKSIEYADISFERHYPYKQVASHLIGYAVKEKTSYVGKEGIEKEYNKLLNQDTNINLTIDIRLQKYISGLFQGLSGIAIVMSTEGEVLSAGSYPEYDLNFFTNGMKRSEYQKLANSPDKPFTNKCIHALYRPGTLVNLIIGLHFESDTKALEAGVDTINTTLKKYGFARKTGIDLPNEFHGFVPSKKWKMEKYQKQWYIGETRDLLKGKGYLLVTPIQIANYTALLATGKLPQPYIKKRIGQKRVVLDANELSKLQVVQNSLSKMNINPQLKVATLYAKIDDKNQNTYSWITTYAPIDNPKYIVTLLVENSYNNDREIKNMILKIYKKLGALDYVK